MALKLKVAAMMLFWFGLGTEFFILSGSLVQYKNYGYSEILTPFYSSEILLNALSFVYTGFGHLIHIVAGYWLSKGRKKGVILGVALSLEEIVTFFVPRINPVLYTADGIAIRILFALITFLIIWGRNELVTIRSANWRPWKNPNIK